MPDALRFHKDETAQVKNEELALQLTNSIQSKPQSAVIRYLLSGLNFFILEEGMSETRDKDATTFALEL